MRENTFYVFKAKAVIITTGGASNVFRPRSTGEGLGRTWYSVFATGSAYGLMIPVGTEMTQMEHRFVPTRFKDGYGPVGMWFQYFHARVTNALGEDYTVTRADELKKYEPYGSAIPTPTPLRNHQMFLDIQAGLGPMYMRTEEAMQKLAGGDPARMEQGAGGSLGGLPGYDHLPGPDLGGAEYRSRGQTLGSGPGGALYHGLALRRGRGLGQRPGGPGAAGVLLGLQQDDHAFRACSPLATAWGRRRTSSPRAPSPKDGWRPKRRCAMCWTTQRPRLWTRALWSSSSRRSGRPWRPLSSTRGVSTAEEVNPHYLTPKQGLVRLQKIMDEYAAGTSAWYTTNGPTLQRGIELIEMLRADLQHLAARNLHELLRCWELWHRTWVGEAHMRHMLFRQETRWPGYYYRADYPSPGRCQLARLRQLPLRRRQRPLGAVDPSVYPCGHMSALLSEMPSSVYYCRRRMLTAVTRDEDGGGVS